MFGWIRSTSVIVELIRRRRILVFNATFNNISVISWRNLYIWYILILYIQSNLSKGTLKYGHIRQVVTKYKFN